MALSTAEAQTAIFRRIPLLLSSSINIIIIIMAGIYQESVIWQTIYMQ